MAELTADRLTAAYMAQSARIRARVVAFARVSWASAASLRDEDVELLVARIVPVVQGGQMQVANLTNAYIQRLAIAEGLIPPVVPIRRAEIVEYRGVPAEEVYSRPAVAVYTALAAGKSFEEAKRIGQARLLSIAATDLQQAKNRQARAAYASSGFDYTVRVLSGTENCALCVIASTQRYRLSELQPVHPGCDCGERGVTASRDPGLVVGSDLLAETYAQIDAKLTSGDSTPELGEKRTSKGKPISDYTDLIIAREHGELGPTLTWRQDAFTGPAGLN